MKRAMAHRDPSGDYRHTLLKIANNVVDQALAGDVRAIEELANGVEGKPTVVIAGDEERPPVAIIHAADTKL